MHRLSGWYDAKERRIMLSRALYLGGVRRHLVGRGAARPPGLRAAGVARDRKAGSRGDD